VQRGDGDSAARRELANGEVGGELRHEISPNPAPVIDLNLS
jgi:hypothetical protein